MKPGHPNILAQSVDYRRIDLYDAFRRNRRQVSPRENTIQSRANVMPLSRQRPSFHPAESSSALTLRAKE